MTAPLSSRERVRLALEHREADRVPVAMVCSGINPGARRALAEHLKATRNTTVDAYLAPLIDIQGIGPDYIGPALPERTDIWGVRRRPVQYGEGAYDEIEHHPLAAAAGEADLAAHPWPSPDWFDYESIAGKIQALEGQELCLLVANGNIFETSWYLRGFENIFVDLATQPEVAGAIFVRVTDFYLEYFTRLLRAGRGRIDLVFTADDIAGQNGLLMSLEMWAENIKPHHVRLNRRIHEHGAKVVYHSDGGVMEAVPGLIDMGIDVLQALQFDAQGMEPRALKERHGHQLCFEGGVSVQRTLPFGTPEDVRREVRQRIAVLGRAGGFILGPSHVIQDGTPPENIVAMFDEATAASA
ncbi:MAG TPA: uroporphyrinogen decarboxylase family protein [Planctomycetota bacterium]|nr:uroporphyrinogen decarboxylase family protein [Planctomycetota bacterium]